MRKLAAIIFVAAIIPAGLAYRLHAQALDPPASMPLVDAARLDAALSHLRELNAQARPYGDTVQAICQRYQIQPSDLDVRVRVDYATGAITRPQKGSSK